MMEICVQFTSCLLMVVFLFLSHGRVSCQAVGIYNITCDPNKFSGIADCNSKSLEMIVDEVKYKNISDLEISITTYQLQLNKTLNFTNLSSLIIRGEGELGMTDLVCTRAHGSQAGIVIYGTKGTVLLQNLNLSFCGAKVSSKFGGYYSLFYSALTISRCKNVEFSNVIIEGSEGLGLVMDSSQGGHVIMTSILFQGNKMPENLLSVDDKDKAFGGGGAYIFLDRSLKDLQSASRTFLFRNCTFRNNTARTKHYTFVYTLHSGYGRGGGLYVYISDGLKNLHVSFIDCEFISNHAFIGGGLSVNIHSRRRWKTQNISVEIIDTLFQWNGYGGKNSTESHAGLGGGIHISFSKSDSVGGISGAGYHLQNVNFSRNYAELGGAVFYFSYREKRETFSNVTYIHFNDCIFSYNRAHMGSAVAMTPYIFQKLSNGFIIVPKLLDCNFTGNSVFVKRAIEHRIGGIGTIYTSFYDVHFEGRNIFHSNKGTPIHAVNAIVNFTKSDVSFINNRAISGGALGLIGSSIAILGSRSYNFTNNTALYQGGAVYVSLTDSTDFISSRSCFFQYHYRGSWNASVIFVGNKAKDETAGHAIYATSVLPCQVVEQVHENNSIKHTLVNLTEIFAVQSFIFDSNADLQPQIATDGAKLHRTKRSPLFIIPGQKYKHGVVITDDLGHQVKASFRVTVNTNTRHSGGIEIESTSAFIGETIQLRGIPRQNATLFLQIVSPRQNYILLPVELLDCPPGFRINNQSAKCVCDDVNLSITRCDLDTFCSHLLPGFWIGILNTSNKANLVSGRCPSVITANR